MTAKSELEQIQDELAKNPLAWGMVYLKTHFRDRSPAFHLKILLESMKHRYFAVASPRSSAKSTILTFLRSIHGICFKLFRFIVIVQNTEQKAIESLNTIKMELRDNQLLYGYNINIIRDVRDDSIFEHKDGFRTRVLCKGMEQIGSVRGEKFGAYRPDLIIIDDLEDDKMVRNPDLRRELQDTFDQALIPAGQQDVCQYLAIGTIFHDDSLMAKLVSDNVYKEWRKLLFRALNKDSKGNEYSLWPEMWSVDKLKEMRRIKPDVFAKEYQNDPVSGALSKFDKADWRYWYIEENQAVLLDVQQHIISKYNLTDCQAAISCDLAWEVKKSSDDTVIMPGLLTPNSELLIDNYICEKGMRPDRLEEYLFNMVDKYTKITKKVVPVGFEKGKYEKIAKFSLKEAMRRRNKFLSFKDLIWGADKIERIVVRLQPRYKQGMVFHRSGMGDLEHQLLRIPSGTHDDLPDAAQGLVQLLQHAPSTKKKAETIEDEGFEFLRKEILKRNKRDKLKYVFGRKNRDHQVIPARISWR